MTTRRQRGRPAKYLLITEWQRFLRNDWRHLNWKVNATLAALAIIVTFLVAIFGLALTKLFGG